MSEKITTKAQADEFLDSYDNFLFDCDGVLWQGSELLPYVVETLDLLRSKGKKLIFVTNNSTKSRQAYTKKFKGLGIDVTAEEIFGSSYSAAVYLKQVVKFPADKKVLVLGESGVEEELASEGVQFVGGTDPSLRRDITPEDYPLIKPDPSIGAVLCGLDLHINYLKMAMALVNLQVPSTLFLATNIDSTYPTNGKLFPGAGTISAPLILASKRQPVSLGKPSQAMMDCIKAKFEFDPVRTVMVGDRLDTDIQFGLSGGLGTLMVLTGVQTEADLAESAAAATPVVPKFYMSKLGDLYELSK
ncbi:HAD-like domain-containing protein [Dipodascopsis tothii]|uniref:HAD-like domain-containing protein n=1 Tax=Dipodascopsis tothii TaxID=44089 RepID=UPI0034CEFF35